jgi:Sec20
MYGATKSSQPLKPATRKLVDDSMSVMHEADEMSQGILEQLHGQREALVTSRTKVEDMHDLALETRGMLKALDRKACTELVFMYSTIALLVVLILVVAWRELTNHGKLL